MATSASIQSLIDALVRSTGGSDPFSAIRAKARIALDQYSSTFGELTPPVNVEALASFLGIAISDDYPAHSKDAELVPTKDGKVSIRVNPDRPESRKRFSLGHEISHTFFPNFQMKTWCRTDARHRNRNDPNDLVEMLCDVGSAELLMPVRPFGAHAAPETCRAVTHRGPVSLDAAGR